ncbi:hypothetical protein DXG01_004731 [Tephrocybe rancida]|nr:hypothetical protein DXG01_004731 [Tephrocybe rancida]
MAQQRSKSLRRSHATVRNTVLDYKLSGSSYWALCDQARYQGKAEDVKSHDSQQDVPHRFSLLTE